MGPPEQVASQVAVKAMEAAVDILHRVAGPVADELGLILRNPVAFYRVKQQIKLMLKLQEFVRQKGIMPQRVGLKILLPSMECASIEEDEDLHSAWAALLASAADPATRDEVSPAYVDVLRLLSKREAVFLNACFQYFYRPEARSRKLSMLDVQKQPLGDRNAVLGIYARAGLTALNEIELTTYGAPQDAEVDRTPDTMRFLTDLDSLLRHRLVEIQTETKTRQIVGQPMFGQPFPKTEGYFLTPFGFQFVTLCSAPGSSFMGIPTTPVPESK